MGTEFSESDFDQNHEGKLKNRHAPHIPRQTSVKTLEALLPDSQFAVPSVHN
jgi:hypothetical protein